MAGLNTVNLLMVACTGDVAPSDMWLWGRRGRGPWKACGRSSLWGVVMIQQDRVATLPLLFSIVPVSGRTKF